MFSLAQVTPKQSQKQNEPIGQMLKTTRMFSERWGGFCFRQSPARVEAATADVSKPRTGPFQNPFGGPDSPGQMVNTKCQRLVRLVVASLVLLCLPEASVAFVSVAGPTATSSEEIVSFFKRAVTSPPDVEYYLVQRHQLRGRRGGAAESGPRAPQYWHGARSGTNYFLCAAGAGDEPLDMLASPMVAGRYGDVAYQFSANAITLTQDQPDKFPNHPLNGVGRGFYELVNQDLNMGLGAIIGLAWNGNSFHGLLNGNTVYGELHLSNGLPHVVRVSSRKDSSPFKSCSYRYPSPPSAFGGFPERTLISTLQQGELKPYLEISLLKLRFAESNLPKSFFSETHFLTTNIVHKNIISNADVMAVLPNGKLVNLSSNARHIRQIEPSSMARIIVLGVMLTGACAFTVYLWKLLRRQQKPN
jgi:hypothetical protein